MEIKPNIQFDTFNDCDIRKGTIQTAVPVPKSKKLIMMTVSFGQYVGERTILSGIASHYTCEELVGKSVTAIINLEPRSMMGIESHGMLLCYHTADGKVRLLQPVDAIDGDEIG